MDYDTPWDDAPFIIEAGALGNMGGGSYNQSPDMGMNHSHDHHEHSYTSSYRYRDMLNSAYAKYKDIKNVLVRIIII